MVLRNFAFNRQHISLRPVIDLDIGQHRGRTGTDGDMLALLDNVHEFVIIPLDGGFKGTDLDGANEVRFCFYRHSR